MLTYSRLICAFAADASNCITSLSAAGWDVGPSSSSPPFFFPPFFFFGGIVAQSEPHTIGLGPKHPDNGDLTAWCQPLLQPLSEIW